MHIDTQTHTRRQTDRHTYSCFALKEGRYFLQVMKLRLRDTTLPQLGSNPGFSTIKFNQYFSEVMLLVLEAEHF